jgi:hypothetical protein
MIGSLILNIKIHYFVHNSLPLETVLRQMNPMHAFTPCFFISTLILSSHLCQDLRSEVINGALKEINEETNKTVVGFEVFTAVVMKSIIFWDMTLCSPLSCTRHSACHLLTRWFAELFFDPEDVGDKFLRSVGCNSTDYTASYPRI